jgi:pimeloyl-ACP methyl ester carboxylesterase
VQVLVSGGSYSHVYWDFSYEPERYSYLKSIVAAGYAAFNFDRIGIGESDHPLSELVSVQSNAYVIHQLIQALRSGQVGGVPFGKVMLVGHSLGSAICLYVASYYQGDVDGVIITGFLHWFNPAMIPILGADIYSVQLDPQFAGQHYPAGYLTTRPGTRGDLFHYLPNTDPSVLATDEATKGSFTDAEAASFFALVSSTDSQQIQVPVLIAVGRYDRFFCAGSPLIDCTNPSTVQRYEAPFYAPAATLQVVIIDNAGHDINLQQNAPTWFAQAISWAEQKVGQ